VTNLERQHQLTKELKIRAKKEGFDLVGIARVPGSSRLKLRNQALQRWLEKGKHGSMKWMEAPRRQDISTLLDGVQSLLAVGLNYYVEKEHSKNGLSIARYAWGRDYHKIIEKRLKKIGKWLEIERPNCQWRVCVDSSPLLDKAWAEEAGIGWIGKHSNLINQKIGSWFVIGHLLCTEALTPDKPSEPVCGQCQKCIQACPTKAISEPFVVDSNNCLAYHTIENKSETLPKKIANSMNGWIIGCDICQNICPWNIEAMSNNDPEVQPQEWILNITKEEVFSWNDEDWKNRLKGSALKRIKPWMWRRNVDSASTKANLKKK
tara:strand:+ start:179 stop:1138 length:960 start_codon:yes stop_codon:yes gene_type:complete